MSLSHDFFGPSLEGKVALVTGAAQGIGRAVSQRLAAAGATVVVVDRIYDHAGRDEHDGPPVTLPGTLIETIALIEAAGGRAIPILCDLSDVSQRAALIDKAVAAAGRVDILVNNAMKSGDPSSVETMPYDMYARTIEFCLTIPFLLCQAVIPVMKRQGGGWILNVGSVSSYPPVRPYHEGEINSGMMVYAAGKAAITRLTQGLAAELQADNIAVNMIAPSGAIRTPGASPYIPDSLVCEPIEYIASVALDMVHSPAAERTGLVAYSMHFAHHYDLAVTTLDGRTRLPRAEWPQHGHPDVNAVGF